MSDKKIVLSGGGEVNYRKVGNVLWFNVLHVSKALDIDPMYSFIDNGLVRHLETMIIDGVRYIADSGLLTLHDIDRRHHWLAGRRVICEIIREAAKDSQQIQ